MKKSFLSKKYYMLFSLIVFSLVFVFSLNLVSAGCLMNVTIINQDPFPAIPGDYVEVVFQLHEVTDRTCDGAAIQVLPSYPFSLAGGEQSIKQLYGPRWLIGHKRAWMIPYRFKVDKDALDGWHELEVRFAEKDVRTSYHFNFFEIKVEEVLTDFEVGIRDYNPNTKEITLEILNIGKNNVEALVIEIPEQDNIRFIGSNRRVIGFLDSNEDTSTRLRLSDVSEGEITINIRYNDKINERREVTKEVYFNPEVFRDPSADDNGIGLTTYILIGIIIILVLYFFFKGKKKRQ